MTTLVPPLLTVRQSRLRIMVGMTGLACVMLMSAGVSLLSLV